MMRTRREGVRRKRGVSSQPKQIVILSSLDTKGEEASYLKDLIEARGFKALLLDTDALRLRHAQLRSPESKRRG